MSGARIRKIEISHFRCIEHFEWYPAPAINCLIGPGDSGKSTVLDAIDFCLGARRSAQFCDADFFELEVGTPIQIAVTIGSLDDRLKNIDDYGLYLRGYRPATHELLPEPDVNAETVLTIHMTVAADLEPVWTLYSERAAAQKISRNLNWNDRQRIAPTRIGVSGDHHLSWRRGSVLNRISEERVDALAELASVAREARTRFGEAAKGQVQTTITVVEDTAKDLGVPVGTVSALLDPDSVSFAGGTIALHDGKGVPLRDLGLGSVRLLIAGLQQKAADKTAIVLVEEIEHGLEPHRLIRFVTSLGAKEKAPLLQVFMTTHSPVALRELSADQLYVVRRSAVGHEARRVDAHDDMQATVRACPEAFLAPAVIVCEGASEIGLVRGLDHYLSDANRPSLMARGIALADGGGDNTYRRANALASLGYQTLILRDDDKPPTPEDELKFAANGGKVVKWRDQRALEQELFSSLSDAAVHKLLDVAIENVGEQRVDDNIKAASSNTLDLAACRHSITEDVRRCLGNAAKKNAKAKKSGWFKSISVMELIARDIIGPDLAQPHDADFHALVFSVLSWVVSGG
jgi:hypothetical protein